MTSLTRRSLLLAVAGGALAQALADATAQTPTRILVHRSASCGCCGLWAQRLQAAGYQTEIIDEPNISAVKARLGVPAELASCHTGEVNGYVLEGHVPPEAVARLLKEAPKAKGLAVPGMPAGSPGMEMGGGADLYEVFLFGADGQRSYGKFQGGAAL